MENLEWLVEVEEILLIHDLVKRELLEIFGSPNSVSTLWGSYGRSKEWCP